MRVWLGRKVKSEEGEKNVILSVGIVGMLISANCELGTKHLQRRAANLFFFNPSIRYWYGFKPGMNLTLEC